MRAVCPKCIGDFETTSRACPQCGGRLEWPEKGSLVGELVDGKYYITKRLGRGVTGNMYRAHHRASESDVALKVLRRERLREKEAVARFYREVRIVSQLSQSNIATIYDFGAAGEGQLYIAMELLEGETVAQMLRATQPLDLPRAVHLIAQACDALSEAHSKNVVHRDINPSNIMVVEEFGERDVVKVLDFGVAKILAPADDRPLTTQTQIAGAAAFLSPEQIRSLKIDGRADLYGLAMVFFTLLAGKPAFRGVDVVSTLMKHITEQIPRLEAINPYAAFPDVVDRFFKRGLAKDPAQRFATAAELKAAMTALLDVTPGDPLENTVTDARAAIASRVATRAAVEDDEATQRFNMEHLFTADDDLPEAEETESTELSVFASSSRED